jgi:hypothetical protein
LPAACRQESRRPVASPDQDLNVGWEIDEIGDVPVEQIATKTGHDPRTFAGLVELLSILEITDNDQQP